MYGGGERRRLGRVLKSRSGRDDGGAGLARDATPLGLAGVVGETQGRPACRSPTLGSGTQSRWDWGDVGTEDKAGTALLRGWGTGIFPLRWAATRPRRAVSREEFVGAGK